MTSWTSIALEQLGQGKGFPSAQILKSHFSLEYEDTSTHMCVCTHMDSF